MSTPFILKNTVICWSSLKTVTLLATAKQLIKKKSICCLKNQAIFFTERLDPQPPYFFVLFFKDPLPPSTMNLILNDSFIKKNQRSI